MSFIHAWLQYLLLLLLPLYKYIMHLITGKCELVRICSSGSAPGEDVDTIVRRQFAFEQCIQQSKTLCKVCVCVCAWCVCVYESMIDN